MLFKNFVKEKLYNNHPVIGIWSIINSPITIDIAAYAGLDFQILDMEHGVFDLATLDNCIRACETVQCSPIVRVPALQRSSIQHALDLGAHGIIVPQVKNFDEAVEIINFSKYAPTGSRGFNPFTRAGYYNHSLPLSSTKLSNVFGLTSIIIENKTLYWDLDKVLSLSALDLFYLGIYDLSFDLGFEGNAHHPEVTSCVGNAIKKIKQAGKHAGVMVKNELEMKKYLELGAQFIVCGVDTFIYHSAINQQVQAFKKEAKVSV